MPIHTRFKRKHGSFKYYEPGSTTEADASFISAGVPSRSAALFSCLILNGAYEETNLEFLYDLLNNKKVSHISATIKRTSSCESSVISQWPGAGLWPAISLRTACFCQKAIRSYLSIFFKILTHSIWVIISLAVLRARDRACVQQNYISSSHYMMMLGWFPNF